MLHLGMIEREQDKEVISQSSQLDILFIRHARKGADGMLTSEGREGAVNYGMATNLVW